jgi:Flp pilus assembly protein TadD
MNKTVGDYTEAIRLDPRNALAYNNRRIAYQSPGKLDEAKANFAQAEELKKAGQ